MSRNLGLLGCGRMGAAIGGHLLDAGVPLAVYDPVAEARRPLVERGAVEGTGPGDVAARSDLVLAVVVDDAQVRAAISECLETARPGTILAICASVRPDTCRELAAAGAERDVTVIDAALVRGERGAEEGQIVLYCGGPAEAIDRVREDCAAFTEAVVHVGAVGAGQVAKTANNILLWACIRADVEALRLGRALGVEPARLREAMAIGSGANRPLAEWGKHRLRWPHKDLEVALALAADAGLELPLVAELPELMRALSVEDLHELL
ncbi:MAG TPA: NAD(P)-dependent oxidoreductase [Gaiellaceae bacterium]|nr:NAD(P)-dependent oxidoreductase [Gaiellaceae bacterium]